MLTNLHTPLLDFHGQPLVHSEGRSWTVKSAILEALVNPNQPREYVDQSIAIAQMLEQMEPDQDFVSLPPDVEAHVLACCRNGIHPLLYLRVKECTADEMLDEMVEGSAKGIVMC